jgi:hypothetical protein
MAKIYSTIHGQCTDAMIHKLTTNHDYKLVKDNSDPIGLLKLIKKICYSYRTEPFQVLAMLRAVKRAFSMTQGHKETNIDYLERFKNRTTVAILCGAEFLFPGVLDFILVESYNLKYQSLTNPVEIADVRTLTQEVVKATLYLHSANKGRYGNLMEDLENDYLKDRDNFPRDIIGTQNLLLNYKGAETIAPSKAQPTNDGVLFAQQTSAKPKGTGDGKTHAGIICRDCNQQPGHFQGSLQCPLQKKLKEDAEKYRAMTKEKPPAPQTAEQLLLAGDLDYKAPSARLFCQSGRVVTPEHRSARAESFKYDANVLNQAGDGKIDSNWVLLDSQSTCDVFYNPEFLNNIRVAEGGREMHIHCNAGVVVVKTVGDLIGYGTVWFYPQGIANILSLALVQKQFYITFDSTNNNGFIVHNESKRKFVMSVRGLYYCDMGKEEGDVLVGDGITTVDKNKVKYTDANVALANRARKFQETTGASLQTFLDIVDGRLLSNNPITRANVKVAEDIYGTSLHYLQGEKPQARRTRELRRLDGSPCHCGQIQVGNTMRRHLLR